MKSFNRKLNEALINPKAGEVYLVSFDGDDERIVKVQYVENGNVFFKLAVFDVDTGIYRMLLGKNTAHAMTIQEFREIVIKKLK